MAVTTSGHVQRGVPGHHEGLTRGPGSMRTHHPFSADQIIAMLQSYRKGDESGRRTGGEYRLIIELMQSLKLGDSLFKRDRRFPAEQLFCPGIVGERVMRLEPRRDVLDRAADQFRDAVDRGIAAGADVDDLAHAYTSAPGGQQVGAHDVVDVGEVAGLRAIAGNGQGRAVEPLLDELRGHQSIGSLGRRARPVHIEIAQTYRREPIDLAE